MKQVVQATCPHCKNTLRIPAEWLKQPMRCKHCQQVFQARPSTPSAAPAPASTRPRASAPPAPRTSLGLWKPVLLIFAALAVGSAIVVFLGPQLANQFKQEVAAKKDGDSIVKVEPVEKDPPKTDIKPELKPDPKPEKKVEIKPETKDPPKPEPKKEPPPDPKPEIKPEPKPKEKIVPKDIDGFPRRALVVSVNDYLLANPLQYGNPPATKSPFRGSSTRAVLDRLSGTPLHFPGSQIVELSDAAREPHPPIGEVVKTTILDFLGSSRRQDRIVLLFAGHAVETAEDAFLVPLDGNLEDLKTLIPLSWLYKQLKNCKARQKVLVLDVCRFNPARGNERPGGDAMGEVLDKMLLDPPPGVQVWSSCIKGQQSHEFDNGSAFLEGLCLALNERLDDIQTPGDSIPIAVLHKRVNNFLDGKLKPIKLEQTTRLTGKEADGGAAFNPNEEKPAPIVIQLPATVDGNPVASAAVLERILRDLNDVPPPRTTARGGKDDPLKATNLPVFTAKALADYQDDNQPLTAYVDQMEQFPLRSAVSKAVKALQENSRAFVLKERLVGATAKIKKEVIKEQEGPAKATLLLKEALADLRDAGKARDKEASKRWQANYDYILARLESRLVYLMEYNFVLAQIRSDSLPALEDGYSAYRLGSKAKVSINESEVKEWVKDIRRTWDKIAQDHPGTPWAVIAQRERMTVLGLEWRPAR